MTRSYAAKRLLEHGPLTFRELVTITGWTSSQVSRAIDALDKCGLIKTEGKRMKFVYSLTGGTDT